MDLRKVKKLIELAEEAGLAELEVTSGDESVRISIAVAVAKPASWRRYQDDPSNKASRTTSGDRSHEVLIKPWCQRLWRVHFIKRPIQRLRPLCRLVMRGSARQGALHCRK